MTALGSQWEETFELMKQTAVRDVVMQLVFQDVSAQILIFGGGLGASFFKDGFLEMRDLTSQ